MAYERFLDKTRIPDEEGIASALGPAKALWLEMRSYIQTRYDCPGEPWFFTKACGWSIRFRKSGKTLCYLFPEAGAFTALMILGREEVRRAEGEKVRLNEAARRVLETTEQLHDGRWLWIRATERSDVRSLQWLLAAKRKPKPGDMPQSADAP